MIIRYVLKLVSDCEPGTGLGGESIDDFVTRGPGGLPIIRGSHLKGVLRDQLRSMALARHWDGRLENKVFGAPGWAAGAAPEQVMGSESSCVISDACAASNVVVFNVTRTAVSGHGTGKDDTLRTTEAVAVGAEFHGIINTVAHDKEVETALRLALLTLPAVGGGRRRGCGSCLIQIIGESRSPAELLKELDRMLKEAQA